MLVSLVLGDNCINILNGPKQMSWIKSEGCSWANELCPSTMLVISDSVLDSGLNKFGEYICSGLVGFANNGLI